MPEQAKVIRKRIKSVSSTKKITRTMEMVATAKLKAAQGRVQSLGPYLSSLRELMRDIGASGVDVTRWPPFLVRPGKRTLLLVITANRGLCGAFNANLIRLGRDTYREKHEAGHDVRVRVAGRKGAIAFRYLGIPAEKEYIQELPDQPTPENVSFFVRELVQPFLDNEVDEVCIVYPHWISVGQQPPTLLRFLPIAPEEAVEKRHGVEPLYEPSAEEILERLLPLYLRQTIYSIYAESVASEHLARRMAMKLATDNAEEMVTHLTRQANKARQAQITKELAEIIGGVEAMK